MGTGQRRTGQRLTRTGQRSPASVVEWLSRRKEAEEVTSDDLYRSSIWHRLYYLASASEQRPPELPKMKRPCTNLETQW
jgi:hypothetical protein